MKRTFFLMLVLAVAAHSAWASVELTSARIYKKQGELAKAAEFYDLAITKEPDNLEARAERGELLGMVAMDAAQMGLRKRLSGDAENPQHVLLDRMMQDYTAVKQAGDDKKIKKLLKALDGQVQEYWWEFYSKALSQDTTYKGMMARESMENAETVIGVGLQNAELAMLLMPGDWSSHFVYAELIGFKGKDDAYVAAWQDALNMLENSSLRTEKPEDYENNRRYARLQLIQHSYATENHAQTIQLADQLLADEPSNVEAVQYKAFSLATLANDETRPPAERDSLKRVALKALSDARTTNPLDENIIYYIGQFNLQLADTAAALAAFDEFLGKAPTDRDVLFMQGLIYLEGEKFGDLNKAADKFGAITKAFPEDGAAWTNYGIALLRQGKTDEGKEAMKKGETFSGN
ncbi:MAG: tetratricopeptide repeat protein [bacterium]|nr:tetratricopeptide repeat protein [bacterium]